MVRSLIDLVIRSVLGDQDLQVAANTHTNIQDVSELSLIFHISNKYLTFDLIFINENYKC